MKSIGPLYADSLKLNHPIRRLFERGWSQETEEPYRQSRFCLVFWVPFIPRGYAFGVWGAPVDEEQALENALKVREMNLSTEEIDTW